MTERRTPILTDWTTALRDGVLPTAVARREALMYNPNMSEQNLHSASAWSDLVFGVYSQRQVLNVVRDPRWQFIRQTMLGTSLLRKRQILMQYLDEVAASADGDELTKARIRVTNYVHALKRGGLIK